MGSIDTSNVHALHEDDVLGVIRDLFLSYFDENWEDLCEQAHEDVDGGDANQRTNLINHSGDTEQFLVTAGSSN